MWAMTQTTQRIFHALVPPMPTPLIRRITQTNSPTPNTAQTGKTEWNPGVTWRETMSAL